jgi:putative membrane protein
MRTLLTKWIVSAGAIYLVSRYLPGLDVASFQIALFVAFVLGLLNLFVKPILFLLTLPINLLTLGLFSFVLNGGMLLLSARFVPGFKVESFLWAIVGAFVISLISSLGNKLLMGMDEKVG